MNAEQRLVSGAAWDDFCDSLKAAGRIISRFDPAALDDLDRAEWYRFLSRLVRSGLERFAENCEPERPRLRDAAWRQSINFQSPDQDHLLAEFVDGSHEYLVRGSMGGLPYFVIASWRAPQPPHPGTQNWSSLGVDGLKRFDPTALQTTGFLTSRQIKLDEQGRFEIVVSRNRPAPGRDWLPITEDCVGLLIRTLYHERRSTVPPQFSIERLDQPRPRPITAAEMSDALAKAAQTVLGYGELVRRWWQDNLAQHPNRIRFSREVYLSNGGVPDRHHGFGTWECAPGEALVIDFVPTPCLYWIFQLCTIWQENLDNYEEGDGYVTKSSARYLADGSVRIIVADSHPGIDGNWVHPFGHVHGGMSLRLIGTQGEPPMVTLRRLSLATLRAKGEGALAAIEPLISGELTER